MSEPYIIPQGTVYLCNNIPFNASYDDTRLFNSAEQQMQYFLNRTVKTLTNYSIVKERQGAIKVQGKVGDYYNINYMYFKNSNFSNKIFYCFVNSCEYLAPETTLLNFQIDVMQTWMFDLNIEPSMVDREHVEDDGLFKHLEDEGLEINERLPYDTKHFEQYLGSKMLVIGSTENPLNFQWSSVQVPYNPFDMPPQWIGGTWLFPYTIEDISDGIVYIYAGKGNKESYFDNVSVDTFTFKIKTKKDQDTDLFTYIKATKRATDNLWYFSVYTPQEAGETS